MSSTVEAILLYALLLVASLFFSAGGLKNLRVSLRSVGLVQRDFSLGKSLKEAAALVLALFFLLTVEALLLNKVAPGDAEKVGVAISSFSIFSILISVSLAPLAEEMFFRGLLQKHLGIILTAVVFALLHFSFGSVIEVAGAFTAGIILGWWVKFRNPSLWPVIFAHAGYNLISILLVFA